MNSRMPDQDNIQERLKTVQEECRQLREENAQLRAILGISQSPPQRTRSTSCPGPKPFVYHEKRSFHAR